MCVNMCIALVGPPIVQNKLQYTYCRYKSHSIPLQLLEKESETTNTKNVLFLFDSLNESKKYIKQIIGKSGVAYCIHMTSVLY